MTEVTTDITPPTPFVEELLKSDDSRFVMFPIKHHDVWELYKKSIDSFWKTDEIDLSKDLKDWKVLSDDEKHFIKLVLAFFSSSDGIICENLSLRFSNEIQISEVRAFYAFQNFMETVHSEMYSLLIETYIDDDSEKSDLFRAASVFPSIQKKTIWGKKWISDNRSSFNTRLIAFAIIEGIFFSSSFAAIFWIKQRNILPGLCLSNEFISRDESIHVDHAVLLYSKLKRRVSKKKFNEIMTEAVSIEIDFVHEALPYKLPGMNADLMSEYVKFVADRLCLQLGYDKIYNSSNPFAFMELISIEKKTNFFERRVSEYSLANKTKDDDIFDMDCAF
jgi:ribonucleotide reductase beta subunit family protein with ferritin-like domain